MVTVLQFLILLNKVLVSQLFPAFCDLMECSPPGSSVHGISQARILEWIAIAFSREEIEPGSPALQAESFPSEPSFIYF